MVNQVPRKGVRIFVERTTKTKRALYDGIGLRPNKLAENGPNG